MNSKELVKSVITLSFLGLLAWVLFKIKLGFLDYYVNPLYLDRLQQVVDWSISKGLVTIIDFHGAKLKENFLYTFDQSDINGVSYYSDPTSAKRIADLNKFKVQVEPIIGLYISSSDSHFIITGLFAPISAFTSPL